MVMKCRRMREHPGFAKILNESRIRVVTENFEKMGRRSSKSRPVEKANMIKLITTKL